MSSTYVDDMRKTYENRADYLVRNHKLTTKELIQINKEIEDELDRIEKDIKKEKVEQHKINRDKNESKAYAHRYIDRSEQVKAANKLYDSYEYAKEKYDPKPERKSVCKKYMDALSENCTIMFGGKRRSKKKSGKKSKKSIRSRK